MVKQLTEEVSALVVKEYQRAAAEHLSLIHI